MNIKELIGKTIVSIVGMEKGSEEIIFTTLDGKQYKMYHEQDCCENVTIDDVCGDVMDLIGSPLLLAEERTSEENPPDVTEQRLKLQKDAAYVEWQDSFTWTFYHFATINGYLDLRWYGESNGYYSESVDFKEVEEV